MNSLYKSISSAVVNGVLSTDFSVLEKAGDDEIKWADGAFDGVSMYHFGVPEVNEEERILMVNAVSVAAKADTGTADQYFHTLGQQTRALTVIDELQTYIIENKGILNARNLYEYAKHLLLETDNVECLKFALAILELFKMDADEELKDAIRLIGLCDEFTLFVIFVMQQWTDANLEIWRLAEKVTGWGRIHAIERIEPSTPEIKEWLLTEGVHNKVLPAYSALTCWVKTDAEVVLNCQLTYEQFAGIRDIFEGLLDEGPQKGISAIQNADESVKKFLNVSQTMPLMIEDYEVIRGIKKYYTENKNDSTEIPAVCDRILHTDNCMRLVSEAVRRGDCIDMAIELGIEYKPYILELLKQSIQKYGHLCGYLMQDAQYREETMHVFRQNLLLEEMKTEPTLSLGIGEDYCKQRALECVMHELKNYPFEGEDFLETGLQSAPIRTRNTALNVLNHWVSMKGEPLEEMLPQLHELITHLKEREPDKTVCEKMEQLLSGIPSYDESNIKEGINDRSVNPLD